MQPDIRKGIYRHYKGPLYEVLDLVRHSETETWHVLYRTCYGERGLWVRPLDMFEACVDTPQGTRQRFAWVAERETDLTGEG